MTSKSIVLQNATGLHARPAAQFVQVANKYKDTVVKLSAMGKTVDGKSILGIMGLGAKQGVEVTIQADGPAENEVLDELVKLIEGFSE